ncbi:MAG: FtsX-like permease family protein [Elusimicrobiota bacterium]|jgi:ABC-type lipoprotein release transport system permease subunit
MVNALAVLRLAWRNLLRNRRRSALAASSIAFGIMALVFGQSLLGSFQRQMVDKSTGVLSGHLQVQAAKASDRKVPEVLLADPARYVRLLADDPLVEAAGPRLLMTGLLHSASASRAALVVGVEPEKEKRLSIMPGYLREGRYLEGPRDVVIGERLATALDLRIGERVVLMAQGPDGVMNSELFRLSGVHRSGSEAFDGQTAYVRLDSAQRLRGVPGLVSHAAARLADSDRLPEALSRLRARLGPEAVAVTWEEVGSEVAGIRRFQNALWAVIHLVILLVVWLGILNAVSMSFFERIREFGILRALGAKPRFLVALLVAESALLGLLGSLLGLLLGRALVGWFGARGLSLPIGDAMAYFMPFDDRILLRPFWGPHLRSAAAAVLVCVLASAAPSLRAARLRVTEALRHI